ncbi:MAG: efflux RND transporter permease subunit, partial [Bacteroidales bacterium]|nr:efflux RND transporter permease subunit [Bacteroidales bacterium]
KVGEKAPKMGLASVNGHPAVLMTITKQPNVGTIQLTEALDAAMAEIIPTLPSTVKVNTEIYRQQRFIDSSISNIQKSLIEGAIFVVLVLFIFLMNWRTTLISLVTIPLALLVSILTLQFMGLSINTMSIGGMAIAIGSLVDDAIVDVENVWKHLRRHGPCSSLKEKLKVIFEASREVRMPILNSTLIIVVSFVPLFCLSGMEGRMLAPLGIAFIVSLFASTLVALTLTPVLCSYLLKVNHKESSEEGLPEPRLTQTLKHWYGSTLSWVLNHGRSVLAGVALLFLATLGGFFTLGSSFLPSFNEGSLTINVGSIPGISLEESDKLGRRAEEILIQVPEIQVVARKTGRAELDEHALGVNVSEIEAPFVLSDRNKEEFLADVRQRLAELPGCNIEIGQPISHRLDAMLSGTQANIAIKLFGSDLNHMFMIGNQIKAEIAGIEGVADLNVEQQIERPQLKIIPRREMLARYGISLPEFAEYVNVLLGGEVVSQVYEGNRVFDLTVKVHDEDRQSMEQIRDLRISTPEGKLIPLSQVAQIQSGAGPNTINRENVCRKIVISCNVAGRDLRSVVNDIQERVAETIELPEGYRIEYGGQFESQETASRILLIASLLSILVILLLLYQQFRDMKQSVVVLFNLPLALIGGVLALFCTSGILSIPAIIGFISLFGIATRNGMLLIDRYNQLSAQTSLSVRDIVMHGSLDRLNPIIMTALTSALALIPLAVGGELPGNEIQSPMAQVILGGLLSSTFLNIFVVPIMYILTHKK